MTRQKLPDGWRYNANGLAEEIGDPSHVVWIVRVSKELVSNHEDCDLASRVPIDLARALLRDGDTIYEAAKKLTHETSPGRYVQQFNELKRLIDESEEQ